MSKILLTGIFIFVKNILTIALSKGEKSVEGSTFRSELVSMCNMQDLIKELGIKTMVFDIL